MNLILLTPEEAAGGSLPTSDARAKHVLDILKITAGGTFFIGIAGGPRGSATLSGVNAEKILFNIIFEKEIQPALPLHFLIGLPRPQTARKILHDAASLGAQSIRFFITKKGDPAYAQSSLWRDGEAQTLLRKGAEQAFSTLIPALEIYDTLETALTGVTGENAPASPTKIFLDIYENPEPLADALAGKKSAILAIGSERGWSAEERILLKEKNFAGAHMGDRVLRVETACIAAGAVALSALGAWKKYTPEA